MPREILQAAIGACAALVVTIPTCVIGWLSVRAKLKALEEMYRKTIFDKRLEAYTEVWRITAMLSSRLLKSFDKTAPEEVKHALEQVDSWYNNSVGGLLISEESRRCFFKLREMVDMLSAESVKRQEVYAEVWRRKMDLRVSLRSDVTLEGKPYRRHIKEEWELG